MRIQRFIRNLIALSVPLLAPIVSAQTEGSSSEPAPVKGLHLRGLAFQLPTKSMEVYMHDPAGEEDVSGVKLEVKNYLNDKGGVIPLRGKNLVFTKSPQRNSIKNPQDIVASLTVPGNPTSLICMFVPGAGAAGSPPCRVYPIEDDLKGFPKGSFKILNLSPHPIRLRLEKQNFDFKVGDVKVITDPPVGPSNSSGMEAFRFENGKWEQIASGIWTSPGSIRELQILFMSPTSGQIELLGVRDAALPK